MRPGRAKPWALCLWPLLALACAAEPLPSLTDSCAKTSAWRASQDCALCRSRAILPACDCMPDPAGGVCHDRYKAIVNACSSGYECGARCEDQARCSCVEGCFEDARCRSFAADLEACLVRACDARCR